MTVRRIVHAAARQPALAVALAPLLAAPAPAEACIGPGAGFALLSSFFVLLTTIVIAILSLLLWPFRAMWQRIKRLIVVGFDDQDPTLRTALRLFGIGPPAYMDGRPLEVRV